MVRPWVVGVVVGPLAIGTGCTLLTDLGGYAEGPDLDASTAQADAGAATDADANTDAAAATDSAGDASSCTCNGLVSAYRFSDPTSLGHDFLGNNNMVNVYGTPKASTVTPPGFGGRSIELDGASSLCINAGYTFDSTADHTLCWWSQPAALADRTNQFAQECVYDTWTSNTGADYLWRLNNCDATAANLTVPGVFAVGKWVQICQTYTRASSRRTVVIDGKTDQKTAVTDPTPIVSPSTRSWCIGSYAGAGGFWKGLIYLPLWFDRALSDAEIEQVHASACCLP